MRLDDLVTLASDNFGDWSFTLKQTEDGVNSVVFKGDGSHVIKTGERMYELVGQVGRVIEETGEKVDSVAAAQAAARANLNTRYAPTEEDEWGIEDDDVTETPNASGGDAQIGQLVAGLTALLESFTRR